MRLWSLDPSYLDSKGLGGVWREGLLAQSVLLGRTSGWTNHSHLIRFKNHEKPVSAIGFYLLKIYEEASIRGYRYSKLKIVESPVEVSPIKVTFGQLLFEFCILKKRLQNRAPSKLKEVLMIEQRENSLRPHPLFVVVDGDVEFWEKSYWREKQKPTLLSPS